eukprot:1399363-Rhodomonas_salina.2
MEDIKFHQACVVGAFFLFLWAVCVSARFTDQASMCSYNHILHGPSKRSYHHVVLTYHMVLPLRCTDLANGPTTTLY